MPEIAKQSSAWGPSTCAIHLGYDPSASEGALTPPIYMTSTYAFDSTEAAAEMFRGGRGGYAYGRRHNPTQALLEERMASLEGGEAALALASGIACIATLMWTLLSAGDEVVIDRTLYGHSYAFFTEGLTRFGVKVAKVDLTRPDTLAAALTNRTKAVYFETPANPNLRVIDIPAVSRIAKDASALVVVDNTFCTPVIQQPLLLGADVVVHSATKYLGGHGDLLGGVLVSTREIIDQVRNTGLRCLTGATLSPMNAFLILRGLQTLEIRMAQHSRSAQAVAELFNGHPAVSNVSYPGLAGFPQRDTARRQMRIPGGLIAVELERGLAAGRRFMDRLRLVTRAVSLGDAKSLIQHPASMTHANYTPEERAAQGIGDGLVRLSVGLENTDDILADVEQALASW